MIVFNSWQKKMSMVGESKRQYGAVSWSFAHVHVVDVKEQWKLYVYLLVTWYDLLPI